MIAIIGATGNTGKVIAEELLAAGEKVRVIGRTAEKLQPFVAKGAEPFVGNVIDADAMTHALRGATAAYIMIPPDAKQKSLRAYDTVVIESLYTAMDNSGLRHAVVLSSIGAQLAEGAGPVSGLHEMEENLKRLRDVNLLFLRAAYFMENFHATIAVYKSMGFFSGLIKAPTFSATPAGRRGRGYSKAPPMRPNPAMIQSGMSADTADQLIEMCKA